MSLESCLLYLLAPRWSAVEAAVQASPATVAQKAVADVDTRHQRELDEDVKMGREAAAQVAKEVPISDNIEYTQKLLQIGDEISAIANKKLVTVTWGDPRLNKFAYEFHVLKGDDVNAFSLPGGFIYLYEGVFKFAESDDEIAGVVAHEISHASFRHIATLRKEQSRFDLVNIPLILAAILSKSADSAKILTGTQLLNQAFMSGWSVKAEQAADYGGLQYMLDSKYNPVGMLTFMERLAFRDRGSPYYDFGIYQTHPPSSERAQALIQHLQEAHVALKRSQVTKSLKAEVLPGEEQTVELMFGKTKIHQFGGSDALTRADAAAAALDSFFDSAPALYEATLNGGTQIVGQDKVLFEVTPDDGKDTQAMGEQALAAVKKILFDLNYRLWKNHDRASGSG